MKAMTSHLDSSTSPDAQPHRAAAPGWLRVGIIAGASALAGGIAAAWWYRKTLTTLREAENHPPNPEFKNLEEDTAD